MPRPRKQRDDEFAEPPRVLAAYMPRDEFTNQPDAQGVRNVPGYLRDAAHWVSHAEFYSSVRYCFGDVVAARKRVDKAQRQHAIRGVSKSKEAA